MKCRRLVEGGQVGVIAPGSSASPKRMQLGRECLEQLGFRLSIPRDPAAAHGSYLHGFASDSVENRIGVLSALLADDDVDVIVAARGAYGTLQLLPQLDFSQIAKARKLIIGYSDVSILLAAAHWGSGLAMVHGPTISKEFAEYHDNADAKESITQLLSLLMDPDYRFEQSCTSLRSGTGEGPILAGNLVSLLSLLGTPWDRAYDGAVLFLEDVAEAPYRVQRMLEQLKLAGKLDNLAGLVFGRFSNCLAGAGPGLNDVFGWFVENVLSDSSYPVVTGFPFGHNGLNYSLPLGCRVRVAEGTVSLLESPIE